MKYRKIKVKEHFIDYSTLKIKTKIEIIKHTLKIFSIEGSKNLK